MVDGFHFHLGYEVAVSISHQETDPVSPVGTYHMGVDIADFHASDSVSIANSTTDSDSDIESDAFWFFL